MTEVLYVPRKSVPAMRLKGYQPVQSYLMPQDWAVLMEYTGQCIFPECEEIIHAKGYCNMHYKRLKNNGHPGIVCKCGPKPVNPQDARWAWADRKLAEAAL